MTNWSFDEDSKSGVLVVEGEMTINHVSSLKERLVEAFELADRVTVDVSSTPSVDVAGLQLLCACQRFSETRNKQMLLKLDENDSFIDFLEEVGVAQDFFSTEGDA